MSVTGDWSFETAVRTLWQEARNEPREGQFAVAAVIWNRLRTGKWGHRLAEVCLYPRQFSGWNDHDPNRMEVAKVPDNDQLLTRLRAILTAAQTGADPTGGALYYYAPHAMADPNRPPDWAAEMQPCGQFGRQLFFKPK